MHPILFSIGIFTIYSFGTMLAAGYLVAASLLWGSEKRRGSDPAALSDLGIGLLLFGLVGARVFYILLNPQIYLEDPAEIFRIQHGGLVFYGGFVGSFLFFLFFVRKKRLPFWETVDRMTPYAILVQAFGRIGCFLNRCCYGKPTSLPIGVVFPGSLVPVHPTQLYEAASLFALFVPFYLLSQKRQKPGALFSGYLVTYGLLRFIVEFARGDQKHFLLGLTLPQFLSLFFILIGLALCFRKK